MDTLELIKQHGISVRQIPYNDVSSFVVSDYTNQYITPCHEIINSVLKRDVSIEEWEGRRMEGYWANAWLEGNTLMCKVARKTTLLKHGGWWMCKLDRKSRSIQEWSYKSDNLAPTLEESVALCVRTL